MEQVSLGENEEYLLVAIHSKKIYHAMRSREARRLAG